MTTPSQSSERDPIEEALARTMNDAFRNILAAPYRPDLSECRWVASVVVYADPWRQLSAERDQAIRERDEARAAVARVEALAKGWQCHELSVQDEIHVRLCPGCYRASVVRAALSGGASEQDKAEEDEQ